MEKYKIVVLPGDGIGPEIVEGTIEILEKLQNLSGNFKLDFEFHEAGADFYLKSGETIAARTLKAIKEADAVLKGPSGLPNVRLPDGTEAGLIGGTLRPGLPLSSVTASRVNRKRVTVSSKWSQVTRYLSSVYPLRSSAPAVANLMARRELCRHGSLTMTVRL